MSGDLHPAEIVARLKMAGTSLRRLSIENGFSPNSLGDVTRKRWPKAERIVGRALKMHPREIWPSRYTRRAPTFRTARKSA